MNTPPPRLSRLAVLAFLLSALLPFGCIATFLLGPLGDIFFQVVIGWMLVALVALVVGILAVVRLYRRKTQLKGEPFAWIAVAVPLLLLVCCPASMALFVLISFTQDYTANLATPLPPTLQQPFKSNVVGPSPAVQVDGGPKIVFASNRSLTYNIYSMDPDGSRQTRLTDLPTDEFGAACSLDGKFILFTTAETGGKTSYRYENSEVWFMRRDGSYQEKLGKGAGRLSLSPDGGRVAMNAPGVRGDMDIFTVSLLGGKFTQLTTHPASDTTPDWSHDGSKIAFASYREGTPFVYVMNADGTDQKRLTTRIVPENGPEWSPDGKTIAFWSGDASGNDQIYLVNADGTQLRQITWGPGGNEAPTWSPDGAMLAFASRRLGNKNIYVIKADGSGQEQLTTDPGEDLNPCWLPADMSGAQ